MLALSVNRELPARMVAADWYLGVTMKTMHAATMADAAVKDSSWRHLDCNSTSSSIRLKEDCIERINAEPPLHFCRGFPPVI